MELQQFANNLAVIAQVKLFLKRPFSVGALPPCVLWLAFQVIQRICEVFLPPDRGSNIKSGELVLVLNILNPKTQEINS